jgi:hypothetical protein
MEDMSIAVETTVERPLLFFIENSLSKEFLKILSFDEFFILISIYFKNRFYTVGCVTSGVSAGAGGVSGLAVSAGAGGVSGLAVSAGAGGVSASGVVVLGLTSG